MAYEDFYGQNLPPNEPHRKMWEKSKQQKALDELVELTEELGLYEEEISET